MRRFYVMLVIILSFLPSALAQVPISKVNGLQAALNTTTASLGARPNAIRGLYNPEGLKRWREGLAEAGVRRDGTGLGGVDIVYWGDSYLLYAGYSVRSDTCISKLRNLLQERFNPVMRSDGSRYGGAGFIPTFGGSQTTWATNDPKDGGLAETDATCSYTPTSGSWTFTDSAWQYVSVTGGAKSIRWDFDGTGTYSVPNRDRITDAEILARKNTGDGTLRLDTNGSAAFAAISSGVGTINCSASPQTFANHWGKSFSGLTAANFNTVQVSADSGSATNLIWGMIAYCNDWDKGIRMMNCGNPGQRLANFYSSGSPNNYCTAITDLFASTAPGGTLAGATRAKLFIINFMLNDTAADNSTTTATETVTTWKALLTTAVARIKGRASRPCILYVIPPMGDPTSASGLIRVLYYASYTKAVKQVMAANKDCMAVFDFNEFLTGYVDSADGGTAYNGYLTTLGWSNADFTHMNNLGMSGLAYLLYQILS